MTEWAKNIKKIMAVHIKLIRNNIKRSSAYGKYFAKAVSQGEVTFDEIAAEACKRNGISKGATLTVATDMQDIFMKKLAEGQTVVLPGLGRFSLRVESTGVEAPEQFSLRRHITRILLGFLPAGCRTAGRRILYDACAGVETVWQKGMKP